MLLDYRKGGDRFGDLGVNDPEAVRRAWSRFAGEVGGTYVPPPPRRWRLPTGTLLVPAGRFTVTIVTQSLDQENRYTVASARYFDQDGLRLRVRRAGPLDYLGQLLGIRDIEVGEFLFDDAFVISGNIPRKIRTLLGDGSLRTAFTCFEFFRLRIQNAPWSPPRRPIAEIRLRIDGTVVRPDHLHNIRNLFDEFLGGLVRIGSAESTPPPSERSP